MGMMEVGMEPARTSGKTTGNNDNEDATDDMGKEAVGEDKKSNVEQLEQQK